MQYRCKINSWEEYRKEGCNGLLFKDYRCKVGAIGIVAAITGWSKMPELLNIIIYFDYDYESDSGMPEYHSPTAKLFRLARN